MESFEFSLRRSLKGYIAVKHVQCDNGKRNSSVVQRMVDYDMSIMKLL